MACATSKPLFPVLSVAYICLETYQSGGLLTFEQTKAEPNRRDKAVFLDS